MDDHTAALENGNDHTNSASIDMYPLNCYYFGFREPVPLRDETAADRVMRLKTNYDAYGMRKSVAAVMLVELFKHPHILLLQVRNSTLKLPGGRLRPDESDIACLKRKLSSKLSTLEDNVEWEIGECVGVWWRLDFEASLYPHLPPNVNSPVERVKLYLVRLPESRKFVVPKNIHLLAIPLCQLQSSDETYGPIISGVPHLLSKFSFNFIDP